MAIHPAALASRQPTREPANRVKAVRLGQAARSAAFTRFAGERRTHVIALPFSPVACALALTVTLAVAYVALIATVMSYATHTVGFSQSLGDDEAAIASIESHYLAQVSAITTTDYAALGYQTPTAELFVPKASETALR